MNTENRTGTHDDAVEPELLPQTIEVSDAVTDLKSVTARLHERFGIA